MSSTDHGAERFDPSKGLLTEDGGGNGSVRNEISTAIPRWNCRGYSRRTGFAHHFIGVGESADDLRFEAGPFAKALFAKPE